MAEEVNITTLVVDDHRFTNKLLSTYARNRGHVVLNASDGKEAMEVLGGNQKVDLIILDREMPEMTGMEVVVAMKADPVFSKIPVIMVTGSDKAEQIQQGIDAGVFYYLTKPVNENVLHSVLGSAERDILKKRNLSEEMAKHKSSFGLIRSCQLELQTIEEAESLAAFLSNCYPEPDKVVSGIAELFTNAIEHGNLEVGYNEKTELVQNSKWRSEIDRRLELPENKDKKVLVVFQREECKWSLEVTDEGQGFEWQKYLNIDFSRSSDNHGRGIAQANALSFDELNYNAVGNSVTAVVRCKDDIEW